jgi:hypothetical protein
MPASESIAAAPEALVVRSHALPWVPSPVTGKSARPLCFLRDGAGFVELLRMEPGIAMPPHRHTGPTHVYQLEGRRRLVDGTVLGPGDYVYEPAGHVDAWEVIGDVPMVALVVVLGDVEDLAPDGSVRGRATTASRRAEYEAHCQRQEMPLVALEA